MPDHERLTGSLEENVLTALCWSDALASTILLKVDPALFSTKTYRIIATAAVDYIQQYNAPPKAHIEDLLEDRLRRDNDEGAELRRSCADMARFHPHLNAAYVLTELDRFIVLARMSRDLRDAQLALDQGDLTAAQQALYGNPPVPVDTPGIWFADTDAMLSFMNHEEGEDFTFGIKTLDRLGVRPERKTVSLLTAPKGKGKSWFLINTGVANRFLGKDVLHITLELSAKLTAQRYVQAITAMAVEPGEPIRVPRFVTDERTGRFLRLEMDNEIPRRVIGPDTRQTVIRKLRAGARRGRLYIKEFATGTLSTAQLKAFLDSLRTRDNFIPDLVLIDQAKNMQMDLQQIRLETGRVFVELRGMAQERDMALVTVNQGNRYSSGAKIVYSNMTAEDWSIIGTADTSMTFSQTDKEREINLARFFVEHARTVRDHVMVLISQSYDTGQFCMNDTLFSAHVEAAVAAANGIEHDNAEAAE